MSLSKLSVEQVRQLIISTGFTAHASKFVDNYITGSVLAEISTADDLTECGIQLPGPVQRALLKSIAEWKEIGVSVNL